MATDHKWLEAVGATMKARREAVEGLSIRALADRIGVGHAVLSDAERGTKKPSARVISMYEHELDLRPGSILAEASLRYHNEPVTAIAAAPEPTATARLTITVLPDDGGGAEVEARLEATAVARCEGFSFGLLGEPAARAEHPGCTPMPPELQVARFIDPLQALVVRLVDPLRPGQSMTWKLRWHFASTNRVIVFPLEAFPFSFVEFIVATDANFGLHPADVFVLKTISSSIAEFATHLPKNSRVPGDHCAWPLPVFTTGDVDRDEQLICERREQGMTTDPEMVAFDELRPFEVGPLLAPYVFGIEWKNRD